MSEPVWHSPWNGQEIFPQRAVWSLCCLIIWFEYLYTFAAFFTLLAGVMMFGSVFQRHRVPESKS